MSREILEAMTALAREKGISPEKLMAALEDIFVVVALLTISVGLILPGMITHTATEVSDAAKRLTSGMLRDFSHAMAALGRSVPRRMAPTPWSS
mgnify:CR=1 FL=1